MATTAAALTTSTWRWRWMLRLRTQIHEWTKGSFFAGRPPAAASAWVFRVFGSRGQSLGYFQVCWKSRRRGGMMATVKGHMAEHTCTLVNTDEKSESIYMYFFDGGYSSQWLELGGFLKFGNHELWFSLTLVQILGMNDSILITFQFQFRLDSNPILAKNAKGNRKPQLDS